MGDNLKHMLNYTKQASERGVAVECSTPIELYLISGFLGAGKTTFLKEVLTQMSDRRVGVLVNEFGAIGLDGSLIKRDGMELVEINHGSIFCSCLKGEFVNALIGFTKLPVDVLIIENSGLADPSNFHVLLEEIASKLQRAYCYKGAVCIVDAISFIKRVKILTPIQNQVVSSNVIMINKIDQVKKEDIASIEKVIREINPNSVLVETSYAKLDWKWVEAQLKDNGYSGISSNHPWNRPAAYSIQTRQEVSVSKFKEFINKLPAPLLRGKGFLYEKGQTYYLDSTQELWKLKVCETEPISRIAKREHTELVLILDGVQDWQADLTDIWFHIFGFAATVSE